MKVPFELETDGRSADRFAIVHRLWSERQLYLPWAVMVHLHKSRAAVLVDNLNQFAETRNVFVIVDAISFFPAYTPRVINRGRFHNQETDAASCDSFIKRQNFRAHMQVILVPHQHAGARFYHAIPGLYRSYASRFEELLISWIGTHASRPFLRFPVSGFRFPVEN